MKKRTIALFLIVAILAPLLIDYFIFGNSIPSNISNEAWAGFLGSYIGGLCTMMAVFITVKYYKDSDKKKEKAAIQPFLHVTVNDREARRGFSLPGKTEKKPDELKKLNISIKNIGNGFATTLVVYTGFNFGGIAFKHVIPVGESVQTYFMVDTDKLKDGLHFGFNFVDSMRNEYIQEYDMKQEGSQIVIDCGYPEFMTERK